jgi:TonB-dependent receptor
MVWTLALLGFSIASSVAAQPQSAAPAGEGSVVGRVTDGETGSPLGGVTVTLVGPDGSESREETRVTDAEGAFAFDAVPAGRYRVRYTKAGHRDSTMTDLVVAEGSPTRADFPLPRATEGIAEEPTDIEEFVVVASPVAEILAASRMDSDELLNTLSAEDMSKFAATDVADALKFVPGVNVVEGQFAVIRGLEERYSSTLYNSAPVPSPDPDRQSIQLDLFPSDIVGDLVVAKTFGPELPGNSSGGSINILTHTYPEQFELKVSTGTGAESTAWDRFLRFNRDSPIGTPVDRWDVIESDIGASIGGAGELLDRGIRFKAVFNNEIDYKTAEGWREGREPTTVNRLPDDTPLNTGSLSLGELSLSSGFFDLTESEWSEQTTGYGSVGLDLDTDGNHKVDLSYFYTKKDEETVEARDNGYFPGFDYDDLVAAQEAGESFNPQVFAPVATRGSWLRRGREQQDAVESGPLWYSSFAESRSFETNRELKIYQVNGDHQVAELEGLRISWAANRAETSQDQSARGLRYFFEPQDLTLVPDRYPVRPGALEEGAYAATSGFHFSNADIEETQNFGRLDAEYEIPVLEVMTFTLRGGGWYEKADRDVTSNYLDGAPQSLANPSATPPFVSGESPKDLGESVFGDLVTDERGRPSTTRDATTDGERKIKAWNAGAKATFWERVDLFGGVRHEKIEIKSLNDPFTGFDTFFGAPAIFPSAYLMFDRLDNPIYGEGNPPPNVVFNDQILGIEVPIDENGKVDLRDREAIEALVNGFIDETKWLPSLGVTVRPIEGLSLRGAYSRTVARPSFRELGYYATISPGSDDVTVGNPQLTLSDVESYDVRAEYLWGEYGELAAVSVFKKNIEDPIESIVVRDALNAELDESGLFRTYFNNPNEAELRGIELEARKNLGFLGPDWLQYLSLGGNFTYIDAEVDRTEAELARASRLFGVAGEDEARFKRYEKSRRLYNQPEWIANADLTFDQPDWGTRLTLSYFAISSVLDAAGVASVDALGEPRSFTLDRYVDSYYQVDFVASQRLWRGLGLKFSVKNLTNSTREIIYDEEQTRDETAERSYKVGRDYSIALTYTFTF